MASSSSYPVYNKTRVLIQNVTKKSFKSTAAELKELGHLYNDASCQAMLQCLFKEVDFNRRSGKAHSKEQLKMQLLAQQVIALSSRPNFPWLICSAVQYSSPGVSMDDLAIMSKALKLSLPIQLLVGLGVANSTDQKVANEGVRFIKARLGEVSSLSNDATVVRILHQLVSFVQTNPAFTTGQRQRLTNDLKRLSSSELEPMLVESSGVDSKLQMAANQSKLLGVLSHTPALCRPADLLQDLGYNSMSSVAQLKEILQEFPRLEERQIANIVAMMVRTHAKLPADPDPTLPLTTVFSMALSVSTDPSTTSQQHQEMRKTWEEYMDRTRPKSKSEDGKERKNPGTWKTNIFTETINKIYPDINWSRVYQWLDIPGFYVPDHKAFTILVDIYRQATQGAPFPLSILFSNWDHTYAQFSLIKQAVVNPHPYINFTASQRSQQPLDGLTKKSKGKAQHSHPWHSLDLLSMLLHLAKHDLFHEVRSLFQIAQDRCPEIFLCGLVELAASEPSQLRSSLSNEFIEALLPKFLSADEKIQNSEPVLRRVWSLNPDLIQLRMIDLYTQNTSSLSRILDVTMSLQEGALNIILGIQQFMFTIDLACLASRQKAFDLSVWLDQRASQARDPFVQTCLRYVNKSIQVSDQASKDNTCSSPQPPIILTNDEIAVFVNALRQHRSDTSIVSKQAASVLQTLYDKYAAPAKLPPQNPVQTKSTQQSVQQHSIRQPFPPNVQYPQQAHFQQHQQKQHAQQQPQHQSQHQQQYPQQQGGQQPGPRSGGVADIEEEANGYFQKIYAEEITIPQVIDMLKEFQTSEDQRKNEVYACMIHSLFDEYRFFGKYPLRELEITGVLFGQLIQHKLIQAFTLGLALRFVLEALRKPEKNRMFLFGKWALEQFKSRVNVWPDFCSWVIQIPHLRTSDPELHAHLNSILVRLQKEGPNSGAQQPTMPGQLQQPQQPQSQQREVASVMQNMVNDIVRKSPDSSGTSQKGFSTGSAPKADAKEFVPQNSVGRSQAPTYEKPSANSRSQSVPTTTKTQKSAFGPQVDIKMLLQGSAPTPPPEEIQDAIHFIVNNVTKTNYHLKGVEMKTVLAKQYVQYFCHYLVVRRVSKEPNNLKMYSKFLNAIGSTPVRKRMLEQTYEKIHVVLASENLITSSPEITLLKHLGCWLGILTLAQNKPILAKKLNLKKLIVEAYQQSRLVAIVPFAHQVLGNCAESKIFKGKNPWLMALLMLLREILDLPKLQLKLRFEIEVLFRELDIKIETIEPATILAQLPDPAKQPERPAMKRSDSAPLTKVEDKQSEQWPNIGSPDFNDQTQPLVPPQYIKIPTSVTLFNVYPYLKRCVPTAIDRAIREIIAPVVDRVVTIACFTTRELILKDFAMEPDETRMRTAAHQMVKNLTSSLALVTCKDPLRNSIMNNLGALLEANCNPTERKLIMEACEQISSMNLDVGCSIIENAAAEQSVRQIDEALLQSFQVRRKHREQTGQPFFNMNIFANSRYPAALPDKLRPQPNPSGLSQQQLRVYEDFNRVRSYKAPSESPGQSSTSPDPPPKHMFGNALTPSPSSSPVDQQRPPEPESSGQQIIGRMTSQQTLDKLIGCLHSLEVAVARFPGNQATHLASLTSNGVREDNKINMFLRMIPVILNQSTEDEGAFPHEVLAFTFAHKVLMRMYERENRNSTLQIDVHLNILECIRNKYSKLVVELTGWLLYTDDERVFFLDITCGLIRARVLHVPELDKYLTKLVHQAHQKNQAFTISGNPARVVLHPHIEFIVNLVRRVVLKEHSAPAQSFSSLAEILSQMANFYAQRNRAFTSTLSLLLDDIRVSAISSDHEKETLELKNRAKAATLGSHNDSMHLDLNTVQKITSEEFPAQFKQHAVYYFDEWMNICLQAAPPDNTFRQYLSLLTSRNVLGSLDSSIRFFYVIIQVCIEHAFIFPQTGKAQKSTSAASTLNKKQQAIADDLSAQAQAQAQGKLSFQAIDALSKLIVWLVKVLDPVIPGDQAPGSVSRKVRMFSYFLTTLAHVLLQDFETKQERFNQRPYLRLFTNLIQELNIPDPVKFDSNQDGVLLAIADCLHLLRPTKVPAFAFAWIDLVAHRMFMPKMLLSKLPRCKVVFQHLFIDLFVLMQPYLRKAELTNSMRLLYKGTLRILLVLLHDFPEFLCEFHFSFCDVIPSSCIQMRNLILSAFPRNMCLPDPFTPNLKVDLLPEINIPPRIGSDVMGSLDKYRGKLLVHLDGYLSERSPQSAFGRIISTLKYSNTCESSEAATAAVKRAGTEYNVPLINSLVLYVGGQGIAKLKSSSTPPTDLHQNACMDVFDALATQLDAEGRYYFLNAIVNQLRYPNSHTHYFSCILLNLFGNAKQQIVMEQITRVLLERLIVHRPHPWGLLITFIELIKNPRYDFWERGFIHCAPDIERLFQCVARSCISTPKQGQGVPGPANLRNAAMSTGTGHGPISS